VAALYFGLVFSSFTSTATVNKIGLYRCLVIGSFFHFTFVLANIMPAVYLDYPETRSWFISIMTIKIVLVVAALLNGFGAGILWCSEGNYTSQCATERSKGYFFGLFWFIFQASQVGGSLIGAGILTAGFRQTWLYVILSALGLIASISLIFVRKPLPHKQ